MSQVDEIEKAVERIYQSWEGGQSGGSAELTELRPLSEKEVREWNNFVGCIKAEINNGKKYSSEWILNDNWVDIVDGQYKGRMFRALNAACEMECANAVDEALHIMPGDVVKCSHCPHDQSVTAEWRNLIGKDWYLVSHRMTCTLCGGRRPMLLRNDEIIGLP